MIKIGQIGCGYWGKNLIRNFNKLGILSALCDIDNDLIKKRKIEQNLNNISTYNDLNELLKNNEINAVSIATPSSTHYKIVKQCLETNKHVFVEKPFTLDYSEAEELVKLAQNKNLQLMVGMVFLYNDAVRKVKHLIDSGIIGQIKQISFVRNNLGIVRNDSDVWWTMAPHDISILLYWLSKDSPRSILMNGVDITENGIYDITKALIKTKNDVKVTIDSSWFHPKKQREAIIIGTTGMIIYDDISPDNKIIVENSEIHNNSISQGNKFYPKFSFSEPLYNECSEFVESVCLKRGPLTSGEQNLKIMTVLAAGEMALKKQEIIYMPC